MDYTGVASQFFANPAVLFAASVLFVVVSFGWVGMFLKQCSAAWWAILLIGVFNGAAAVAGELFIDRPMPYLMMLLVPLFMTVQIRIVYRDVPWAYLFIFSTLFINFSAIHDFVVAAVGLMDLDTLLYSGSREHRIAVFSLSLLFTSAALYVLRKFMPVKEIYSLVHSREKTLWITLYMVISGWVLMIASATTVSIMFGSHIAAGVKAPVYTNLVLKDSLILICSYVITLLQCRWERISQQKEILGSELHREKVFRSGIRSKALISCVFNITRGCIEEGGEYFEKRILNGFQDNFNKTMQYIVAECVHPDDRAVLNEKRVVDMASNVLVSGECRRSMRFRVSPKAMKGIWKIPQNASFFNDDSREWIWFEAQVVFARDKLSDDIVLYMDIEDVDASIAEKNKLLKAASFDALTGLYNRAALEERVRDYLSGDEPRGAMFMIDMDNFKTVNDCLGHQAGDKLLIETAKTIKSVFRANDLVCRMGGDEFCVFAFDLHARELIDKRAKSLLESAVRKHSAKGGDFYTTLSVGIAVCPEDGADYATLYKNSDSALYKAKSAGKNTYSVYCHASESK